MRLPNSPAGQKPQAQQVVDPTPDEMRAAAQFLAEDRRASEASLAGATLAPAIEGNAK